jgi:integrase
VKLSGLDGVRLHDLRHGFASAQTAAGTHARIVSDLLGHASIGFTLMTYTHPSDEAVARAAAVAEGLYGSAISPSSDGA